MGVLLTPLNANLSRPGLDVQARLLAPDKAPEGVLVVDIDDRSLAALKPQFGPWPFRRDVYALAIDQLRELGATAIAFDLLLADAQPGDEALARAIARPGAPVVLAAAGLLHASDDTLHVARDDTAVPASQVAAAQRWPTITLPTPSVWPRAGRAPPLGIITTPLDTDGLLRALPLWHTAGEVAWPLLPLAVHRQLAGKGTGSTATTLRPAFAAAPAAPPVVSFAALMAAAGAAGPAADALRGQIEGRVVFIGSSALLADAVMTVQGQASGTSTLAQAYTALRDGRALRAPALWVDGLLLLLALLPGAGMAWRGRPSPRHDAAHTALALLAMAAVAGAMLWQRQQLTSWAAPVAAAGTGLALALLLYQRQQAAAQRRLALQLAVAAETARAKGEFLANVSHEIRTPLNALLGVAELLAASPLNSSQQHQVHLFQDAGRSLHELINDLLDLSKIEAGKLELDRQPFSLRTVLLRVTELMRPRAQGKGLQLLLQIDEALPEGVTGDGLRLEQALNNLVGNAIKFTSQGEVRVRAAPDAARAGFVAIDVIDTGIGIAPSKLDTIFEPFTQADGGVTRMYGGTGLGLSITRRVAELMGGAVTVSSTPGLGSVFSLVVPLPAAKLAPAAAVPAVAPPAPVPAQLRAVLLAEDNEVNVYLFQAMVDGQPVQVEVAANGLAALDLLRQRAYDVAFLDVQMPGLDGLSVTRALRQIEAAGGRPRTPVVALTANAFTADVQASLAAGCDRHLAKPYTRAQLLQAIGELAVTAGSAPVPGHPVAETAAAATPAAERGDRTPFDRDDAVRRLGGDQALYQRVADHALVFMQGWVPAWERARGDADVAQALRLVRDLHAVAATLGATELAGHVIALEDPLRRGADVEPALAAVRSALASAIVALSRRPGQR
ncbi:MAG: histidine kinase [Leptothrix sp. (in: Bacteria)]|nr:histidine kinase [Leptothrix sp. (in: b-proteobacteria)]